MICHNLNRRIINVRTLELSPQSILIYRIFQSLAHIETDKFK